MSRSGYSDECEYFQLWRGAVVSAIGGKRGQALLRELAAAMDAMPEKKLITDQLIDEDGACCTLGTVFKARGVTQDQLPDEYQHGDIGQALGIAPAMAQEIAYENDEYGKETPEQRWTRMRAWVAQNLRPENPPTASDHVSEQAPPFESQAVPRPKACAQ